MGKNDEKQNNPEKYNLLVLIISERQELAETAVQAYSEIIPRYSFEDTVLTVILINKTAHRIIAGKQICDIDDFSIEIEEAKTFSGDGEVNIVAGIQKWIYQIQANMYSDNLKEIKTALFFINIPCEIKKELQARPSHMIYGSNVIDYYDKIISNDNQDYRKISITSVERLLLLAKDGDDKAQYELGIAYLYGRGVERDLIKAKFLLYEAYMHGNMEAFNEYKRIE